MVVTAEVRCKSAILLRYMLVCTSTIGTSTHVVVLPVLLLRVPVFLYNVPDAAVVAVVLAAVVVAVKSGNDAM
jgi:hypothetical protein